MTHYKRCGDGGSYTDTAGKEGDTANSREGGRSGGIDRDQGAPIYQMEKDWSSFVCEQCQFSDLNVTVWKHTFEQNKGHVLFPLFHVY